MKDWARADAQKTVFKIDLNKQSLLLIYGLDHQRKFRKK